MVLPQMNLLYFSSYLSNYLSISRIETVPGESLRGTVFINELILDGLATDELIPRSLEVRDFSLSV